MLRTAQVSPFEARGQVFVVASAETPDRRGRQRPAQEPGGAAHLGAAPLPAAGSVAARPAAHPAQPVARRLPGAGGAGRRRRPSSRWRGPLPPPPRLPGPAARPSTSCPRRRPCRGAGGWEDPRAARPWARGGGGGPALARASRRGPPARRARLALAEALLERTRPAPARRSPPSASSKGWWRAIWRPEQPSRGRNGPLLGSTSERRGSGARSPLC